VASDNSSLYQKLRRVADSPSSSPMEKAAANRRLRKLTPTDLTAEQVLSVDDSSYGETEEQWVKRTAPKTVKVGRKQVKVRV
jgi:hypothetical protein